MFRLELDHPSPCAHGLLSSRSMSCTLRWCLCFAASAPRKASRNSMMDAAGGRNAASLLWRHRKGMPMRPSSEENKKTPRATNCASLDAMNPGSVGLPVKRTAIPEIKTIAVSIISSSSNVCHDALREPCAESARVTQSPSMALLGKRLHSREINQNPVSLLQGYPESDCLMDRFWLLAQEARLPSCRFAASRAGHRGS